MTKPSNKILVLSAYLFFVPALYIILTEHRRDPYLGFHGAQAFLVWLSFFSLYILIPQMRYNIWVLSLFWLMIISAGITAFIKGDVKLPVIGKAADFLL